MATTPAYYHQKEPLKPYPVPTRPWQVVGTDLCEMKKKEYLVIVDAYSSYPEVIPLSSEMLSKAVIKGMKVSFARHGIRILFIVIMDHVTIGQYEDLNMLPAGFEIGQNIISK
jgi:hypothetical protein